MRSHHRSCAYPDDQPPVQGNLPAELNRFMGRAEELAELGRLLDDLRLVTVAGAGGVGKSRFAAHRAAAPDVNSCSSWTGSSISSRNAPGSYATCCAARPASRCSP
jgi:hypothetical protein